MPEWFVASLVRRGVSTAGDLQAFLSPTLEQLLDPHHLKGMSAAIEILAEARERSGKIAIVGDYDVDGISGTAILLAGLKACGLETIAIIPDRVVDGYGFQPQHVNAAIIHDCSIIVTVDCGTNSKVARALAEEANLKVIIADHHLPECAADPSEGWREGQALINPWQDGCEYPFKHLSGAGLAFKLVLALAERLNRPIDPRLLIRVACLGTIADLVPLLGENRIIAAIGLQELAKTRSMGLRALIKVAKLQPPLSAQDIGFQVGPRINAPGRLATARIALDLFFASDQKVADLIALELDRLNQLRKSLELLVVLEARAQILSAPVLAPIIVLCSASWHIGVIGIAAGKLSRELNRPTLLLAVDDTKAIGSGRSIDSIDLHAFLAQWESLYLKFGGHAQAIGITIRIVDLPRLLDEWTREAARWQENVTTKVFSYEISVSAGEVNCQLFSWIQKLAPFGMKNPNPVIRINEPLRLVGKPTIFGTRHISARVQAQDGSQLSIVAWDWSERVEEFAGPFEILGQLEIDRFKKSIVVRLVDIRPKSWRW